MFRTTSSCAARSMRYLHFASPASPNPLSPSAYFNLPIQTMKAGALGTHNTLGVAKARNARFLLASTSEIYGDPLVHPQNETYAGNVDPIGPRSVYDEAKRFAESLTMAYHRQHGVDTRIVRIFNTYGPRMDLNDGRALPNLLKQALLGQPLTVYGNGMQTRSFCYVDDLIEGIFRLLLSDEHLPVNIGNPDEMTLIQFAEAINRIVGNRAGITFVPDARSERDPQRRQPDITRAQGQARLESEVHAGAGIARDHSVLQAEAGNRMSAVLTNPVERSRFLKFMAVGAFGAVVDFGIANLLTHFLSMALVFAGTISFACAIISNFLWNRYWTYPDSRSRPLGHQLGMFTMVNVAGVVIRIPILHFVEPILLRLVQGQPPIRGSSVRSSPQGMRPWPWPSVSSCSGTSS